MESTGYLSHLFSPGLESDVMLWDFLPLICKENSMAENKRVKLVLYSDDSWALSVTQEHWGHQDLGTNCGFQAMKNNFNRR